MGWTGPPWPATLVFIATYVTYAVAVRLELHLLVGVWLVTDATIVFGYAVTGAGRDTLNQAYLAIGFATLVIAFGYLVGTDDRLTVPRRDNPRTRVPARSVALAGEFTGVYPRESPGGWQLIGRTSVVLFDADRDPPALLAAGDRLRFVAA